MGSTSTSPDGPLSDGDRRRRVAHVYRFGPYELRTGIAQLSKHGVRIRLQMKPAQLLEALLETPGELISRETLRQRLWPEGTFVDFEGSINTAINRLRATLNDAPDAPRYIETVPRLGYRFIHPVVREPSQDDEPAAQPQVQLTARLTVQPANALYPAAPFKVLPSAKGKMVLWTVTAAMAMVVIGIYAFTPASRRGSSPHFRQLTFHTGSIPSARFLPGLQSAAYTSFLPGGRRESKTLEFDELKMKSLDSTGRLLSSVDSRGRFAFVAKGTDPSGETRLVAMTPDGNEMGEVAPGVLAADWSPKNGDLALVRREGALSVIEFPRGHAVFTTRGWVSDLRVSPWGDRVAFLEHPARDDDGGFVEVVERQGNSHRVTPLWSSASGLAWSASGREIWFSAGKEGATLALYGVTLTGALREIFGSPASVRLLDFSRAGDLLVTLDDTRMSLIAGGADGEAGETDISKFDCSHVDAISDDGRLVLFTECGSTVGRHYTSYLRNLQTSTTRRLGPGRALALSPDGRRAITIDPQDRTVLTLYEIASGASRKIPSDGIEYQWARFIPGKSEILVGGSRGGMPLAIYTQCPDSGALERAGVTVFLDDVTISPTGQQLAGIAEGRLRAFDWKTGREMALSVGNGFLPLAWSADGAKLYIMNKRSLEMSSLEVASGAVDLWRKLPGQEKPGFVGLAGAVAAPQAGIYAYSLHLSSSRLYLVSGLT